MTVSNETMIMVGLGEVKASKDPDAVLACLGLGSCIAVAVYDPKAKVGGMAHVVLPKSRGKAGDRKSSVPSEEAIIAWGGRGSPWAFEKLCCSRA